MCVGRMVYGVVVEKLWLGVKEIDGKINCWS